MGWKIITDHLEKQGWIDYKSYKGRESKDYKGGTLQIQTYDDDGILYYTAHCDDEESQEQFHDWSRVDSGTVGSKTRVGTGKWKWFIG